MRGCNIDQLSKICQAFLQLAKSEKETGTGTSYRVTLTLHTRSHNRECFSASCKPQTNNDSFSWPRVNISNTFRYFVAHDILKWRTCLHEMASRPLAQSRAMRLRLRCVTSAKTQEVATTWTTRLRGHAATRPRVYAATRIRFSRPSRRIHGMWSFEERGNYMRSTLISAHAFLFSLGPSPFFSSFRSFSVECISWY